MKNILSLLAVPAYAQDKISLAPTGNFSALQNMTIPGMISGAISLVMLVVALVFFFILILGGLKWITSEGDEKAVGTARNQITNGLIGLAIVFAAFAIMRLIGTIFNINIIDNLQIPVLNK